MDEKIIGTVRINKNRKYVTISKKLDVEVGDYVVIKKLQNKDI